MYKSEILPRLSGLGRSRYFFFFIILSNLFPFFPVTEIKAQGNLLILPRRVVFQGSKKSEELSLSNTGKDTSTYIISLEQMRMKDDGSFEKITKPDSGQLFADKYLRYFPRTVTLAPKETQMIKMQVTKADKLEPGEYRSHIYFRAVPKQAPLGEKKANADSSGLAIQLTPVFGITIPVIIRVGENNTTVKLTNPTFEMVNDTLPQVKLVFIRAGNMSVYGDIWVNYISPEGKVIQVQSVKGLAVYTPNSIRNFQFNLQRLPGVDYHKGKLQITYKAPADSKSTKLADAEILLH
jgi:hypothetical protein